MTQEPHFAQPTPRFLSSRPISTGRVGPRGRARPGPTRVAMPGHRGSLPPTCSALGEGPLGRMPATSGKEGGVRWVEATLDGQTVMRDQRIWGDRWTGRKNPEVGAGDRRGGCGDRRVGDAATGGCRGNDICCSPIVSLPLKLCFPPLQSSVSAFPSARSWSRSPSSGVY